MPGIFVSWESQGGIQHVCTFMYVPALRYLTYGTSWLGTNPMQAKQVRYGSVEDGSSECRLQGTSALLGGSRRP